MTKLEQAIQYVRDNKTWTDAEEVIALYVINLFRCDIKEASTSISDKIHDLMEEWSADNDMPEDWWYNETNEDEIFFKL